MLAGCQVVFLNWPQSAAGATFPAILFLIEVVLQDREVAPRRAGVACWMIAVAVAANLLSGHIETSLWTLGAAAIYALVAVVARSREKRIHLLLRVAAMFSLGMGIAALQLLPFAEYLGVSASLADRSGRAMGALVG